MSRFSLSRLFHDRGGNFALMTALIAVPLLYAAGSAIDMTSAFTEKTNLQAIADSAALAGAGIYDGTNSADAIAKTQKFLSANTSAMLAGATNTVTMSGQDVQVTINANYPNQFMQVAGISSLPVAVTSTATAPMMPKTVTLTPTLAQGYYYKKVTVRVIRPNTTNEVIVGTITYQPTTHANSGQGTMTVSPSGTLDLGTYSDLILQMDIKDDGCATGYVASYNGNAVNCSKTSAASSSKYDLTLRTDNPDTSYYLFVNGTELAKGVTSPLASILVCGSTSKHAWEDGGGWDRQDLFYTASTTCAPDGAYVRLTQ